MAPRVSGEKEKLTINFGNGWLFEELLKKSGYDEVIKTSMPENVNIDTLITFIAYMWLVTIRNQKGSDTSSEFWAESYFRVTRPDAKLDSDDISELFLELGAEETCRRFYEANLDFASRSGVKSVTLIDETMTNEDFEKPLPKTSGRPEKTGYGTGMFNFFDDSNKTPVFVKFVSGDLIDVATAENTFEETEARGIEIDCVISNTGHFRENIIKTLYEREIPFIVKLPPDGETSRELFKLNGKALESAKNRKLLDDMILYSKKTTISMFDKKTHAWLILAKDANGDKTSETDFTVVISTDRHPTNHILIMSHPEPTWNLAFGADEPPEESLPSYPFTAAEIRGNIIFTFMIMKINTIFDDMLFDVPGSFDKLFSKFGRVSAKIFPTKIKPGVPKPETLKILNGLGLTWPEEIKFKDKLVAEKIIKAIEEEKS